MSVLLVVWVWGVSGQLGRPGGRFAGRRRRVGSDRPLRGRPAGTCHQARRRGCSRGPPLLARATLVSVGRRPTSSSGSAAQAGRSRRGERRVTSTVRSAVALLAAGPAAKGPASAAWPGFAASAARFGFGGMPHRQTWTPCRYTAPPAGRPRGFAALVALSEGGDQLADGDGEAGQQRRAQRLLGGQLDLD